MKVNNNLSIIDKLLLTFILHYDILASRKREAV